MTYVLISLFICVLSLQASEPSKAETELKQKLKALKEKFAANELAARRKFLEDAEIEKSSLSIRDRARIESVVIQVELEVRQTELKKWVPGIWIVRSSRWLINEDGTALIDVVKMKWKIVGEAVFIEDANWSRDRMWYLMEMVGPNSGTGKTKEATSFTAERQVP